MKLCIILLFILIPAIPAKQYSNPDSTPTIYIVKDRIKLESIYLFGEKKEFNTYLPSHPNYGRLAYTWTNTNGWDIFSDGGTPVYAIMNGIVVSTKFKENGRTVWGYNITTKGKYNSVFYTHLDSVTITKGDTIQRGQLLGYIGEWPDSYIKRGKKMDAHLHIALRKGKLKDYLDSNLQIIPELDYHSVLAITSNYD